MNDSLRTRFYRDKLNGRWLGVCAGIADYTGIDVTWVRMGMVGLTLMGTPAPLIYLALGFFLPRKPEALYGDRNEQLFWQGVRQSPGRTAREVRARFRDIDRRLAAVEAYYVTNNPRLSAEIENLR